jgi:hypothetical protein
MLWKNMIIGLLPLNTEEMIYLFNFHRVMRLAPHFFLL